MWFKYYIYAIKNLIWRIKTKINREEEAQKEDYLSVHIYENISILPTAWCPLNNENFYTVNIYWKKKYSDMRQNKKQRKLIECFCHDFDFFNHWPSKWRLSINCGQGQKSRFSRCLHEHGHWTGNTSGLVLYAIGIVGHRVHVGKNLCYQLSDCWFAFIIRPTYCHKLMSSRF